MWWSHGDLGWGGWLVMSAAMIAIWAVVIWVLFTLVRGNGSTSDHRDPDPERILAARFAAGEIDDEEYHRRLATLHGDARVRTRG